ncbi:MAG: choice-of-anchor J domain-containing protein [Bacteroidales bacterium]|nr:choice-of-anchor J domain-containing protein [Bacteroidales bacterium]
MKKTIFLVASLFLMVAAQAQEWNFVNSFSCSTGRQHAVVFDGENIYTAAWGKSSTVLSMFYKYDLNGNLLDEFDVAGVDNSDNYMRDMTFDGTYFYGCDAHSGTIWCYDLHNKTLVTSNCISTSLSELGTCSYDPVNDAFWVGERATGSSPNLMLNLKLVSRSGQILQTATAASLGGHTVHGTGYFIDENGGHHLLLNAVEGFTDHVFDYNIDTDVMSSNYIFDFSTTPGWGMACSAGGAYIGEVDGSQYFFGDVDKSPNLIGIYSLGEYTPAPPTPPEGDILFDFNDGIMHLNTLDGDGDGYNWEMRQNWGHPENPFSVTSASVDISESPLFPENYLVTPYKLDCEQVLFSACVQDITHPNEHLGVAVSTTVGDDPDAFTIVWDVDMTAKEAGNWYQYNVDLRAYQGQDIYVAIVHYNCTDQFMVNVDDILLNRVYINYEGVNEIVAYKLSVYPNPTSESLMVESNVTVNHYEVYNIMGEMLMSKPVDEKRFTVNVSELPAGTYLIKMVSEGLVQTQRFVKK